MRNLLSARIKFREFFKIAKIAKFSKNKAYVNHQNRSLHDSFDAKSKLKIDVSDYPIWCTVSAQGKSTCCQLKDFKPSRKKGLLQNTIDNEASALARLTF